MSHIACYIVRRFILCIVFVTTEPIYGGGGGGIQWERSAALHRLASHSK